MLLCLDRNATGEDIEGYLSLWVLLNILMCVAIGIISVINMFRKDSGFWIYVEFVLAAINVYSSSNVLSLEHKVYLQALITNFLFSSFELVNLVYRLLVEEDVMAWVAFPPLLFSVFSIITMHALAMKEANLTLLGNPENQV